MIFFNKLKVDKVRHLAKPFVLAVITIFCLTYCSRDDINEETRDSFVLKATIEYDNPETKTQYNYSNKSLKTFWSQGDEIAVFSLKSAIYRFEQKGAIGYGGYYAYFFCDEEPSLQSDPIFAVYPYSSNLSYSLKSQTGKIDDLSKYDFLAASTSLGEIKYNEAQFSFGHLCAILRLPKGTKISDESNNGSLKVLLKGERVANGLTISSETGKITKSIGEISVSTIIKDGELEEDLFITFIPVAESYDEKIESIESIGSYMYGKHYKYTIDTDKGDHYEFYRDIIHTSVVYNVMDLNDGLVVFDDENFKSYCLANFDYNKDGEISYVEARAVDYIDIENKEIKSLKGIEHFKYLVWLDCSENQLTSLDLNNCQKLKKLECDNNQLTSLDLSNCQKLEELKCDNNQLTSLKVHISNNGTLKCNNNQLSSLDLSNSSIEWLECRDNQLTTLDLNVSELHEVDCSNNQLTSLNLKAARALTNLYCTNNQLTSLDLSNNLRLSNLECSHNQLKSLDLNSHTNLFHLYCWDNNLISLNVSGCTRLYSLSCGNNKLTSLNVNGLTNLYDISCRGNDLTSLTARGCGNLVYISDLFSASASYIVYEANSAVFKNLSLLDLSDCKKIKELSIGGIRTLKDFKVSGCSNLTKLECYSLGLTSLDLSGCTLLKNLRCSGNELTSLDISRNPYLETLKCYRNQLTSLEVNNSKLKSIDCSNNKLSSLNFGEKANFIETIDCSDNQLNVLDISKVSALKLLYCIENQITSLDVSHNLKLTDLYAWPQKTLKTIRKKKGQYIKYWKRTNEGIYQYTPSGVEEVE